MNPRRPQLQKMVYGGLIVVLLIPLFLLSQPATKESPGGQLARLRNEYNLGQADLGQIDPASETIKLATLGMRGVAVNVLWEKANHYKKVEDWTSLKATVEQITNLQPNFYTVWDFQSHNLAYNISVEFDDYRDRYAWVIEGIRFLEQGAEVNDRDPRFRNRLGWIIAQKIGRADEHRLFRRMFKEDDDFHGDRPRAARDNWLVGHEMYVRSVQMVEAGMPLRPFIPRKGSDKGGNPVVFFSEPAKALINYADALEEEGRFGDVTRKAWIDATDAFLAFGDRDIETTFNIMIHLNDLEKYQARITQSADQLDALQPGLRDQIKQEKLAKLSAEERSALAIPAEKRTQEEAVLAYAAEPKVNVTHKEVASRISDKSKHQQAWDIAVEATEAQEMADLIGRYRDIVNFTYWRDRAKAGRTQRWQEARQFTFKAGEELAATRWESAKDLYEMAFVLWDQILHEYPAVRQDSTTIEEIVKEINRYRDVLGQLNLDFPDKFVLQYVLDEYVPGAEPPTPAPPPKTKSDQKT